MIILSKLKNFYKNEDGATAIEYSLIAAGIALAIITAVNTLGTSVKEEFETTASIFNSNGELNSSSVQKAD